MGISNRQVGKNNKSNMSKIRILQKLLNVIPFGIRSHIRKIPLLKQTQKFLLKNLASNAEFDAIISGGPAKGLKFPVALPQDKGMWIGTWELEFASKLADLIEPGFICYDIGAYKGYYGGIMALKGAEQVFIFEPMPKNASKINHLINLNPALPLTLVECAVGGENGKVVFNLMPEETMGKLNTSEFQTKANNIDQIEVDGISIDYLVENGTPAPDFVKIDVEGAEEFVLGGAIQVLKNHKPILMIEIHSPEIGLRCLSILGDIYNNITTLETGEYPDETIQGVYHLIILP